MRSIAALALTFALVAPALGDDPAKVPGTPPPAPPPDAEPEPKKDPPKEPQADPKPGTDPTAEDEAIRIAREANRVRRPDELPIVLPTVAVKGIVEVEGRAPSALLQIGTGVAIVHVGDRIVLEADAAKRGYAEMQVAEISEKGVRVVFSPGAREVIYR